MRKITTISFLLPLFIAVISDQLQAQETGFSQETSWDFSQDFTLPTILKSRGVPAYPFPVKVKQSDGTPVALTRMGDGFLNWYETAAGYTVLKNGEGDYMYAEQDSEGRLVPSDIPVGSRKGVPEAIPTHLRHSTSQVSALKKAYFPEPGSKANPIPFPSTGSNNVLVLLIEFADLTSSLAPQEIENLMTAPGFGGTGSFRDYYLDVSYNNLSLECTVVPWVQVSQNMRYYGESSQGRT